MSVHDGKTIGVPSARQVAIAAIEYAIHDVRYGDAGTRDTRMEVAFEAGAAIDAIPAHVLALLAIEAGALEACGWRYREPTFGTWVVHHWRREDHDRLGPDEPVYRIVPTGEVGS